MNSLVRKGAGVLALLAALLLLVAGWSFRPVSAQLTDTKTVTASFSPSPAENGQEVTLTVDLQGWFGGAQFIIDYDADKLSYIDGSARSSIGATINDTVRGQFNMLYVNTSGIDLGDQDFFTARFTVNAAPGESLEVSFSKTDICSTDATQGLYPVDVQIQPLTVAGEGGEDTSAPEASAPETSTPEASGSETSAPADTQSSGESASSQSTASGSVASGTIVLPQGQQQLLAAPNLSGAVTWSSSDESVATVDQNGMVTMVGDGDATITASDESGEEETFHLATEPPVSSGLTSASGVDDPEDATFLWWILGGIGAVLVIAAVAVVVIVLKKKR